MTKKEELENPNSCLNKAKDDELIFVLLERDAAAIIAVTAWINARIKLKLNSYSDPKITEALLWIDRVLKNEH